MAKNENKTETSEEEREGGEGKRSERCFVRAALFHSGTPLVARSTAEAASQSPLPVCPVTLHHWGQRALRLPINEPASASAPLSTPRTPTIQRETKLKPNGEEIVAAAP